MVVININIGTQGSSGSLALEMVVTMALMVRSIIPEKAN